MTSKKNIFIIKIFYLFWQNLQTWKFSNRGLTMYAYGSADCACPWLTHSGLFVLSLHYQKASDCSQSRIFCANCRVSERTLSTRECSRVINSFAYPSDSESISHLSSVRANSWRLTALEIRKCGNYLTGERWFVKVWTGCFTGRRFICNTVKYGPLVDLWSRVQDIVENLSYRHLNFKFRISNVISVWSKEVGARSFWAHQDEYNVYNGWWVIQS